MEEKKQITIINSKFKVNIDKTGVIVEKKKD